MEHVLLVSSTQKGLQLLQQLLKARSDTHVTAVASGAQARRLLADHEYALVVINAPLSDEYGHELACLCAGLSAAGIILIVKSEMTDQIAEKVEDDGVFVVGKPISRPLFYQSLKLVEASRRRILGLKNENVKLQHKLEEIRLVNRAKCVLIEQLRMSEQQAHRYIEKQAMDMRVTRREVAQGILNTYER